MFKKKVYLAKSANKLCSVITASFLCLSLMPFASVSQRAVAAEPDTIVGSATLTIICGLEPSADLEIIVNKSYDFAANATIKDLLDNALAQGDIGGYTIDPIGGYLTSITKGVITLTGGSSYYWAQYENGAYADFTKGTVVTQLLENTSSYQFSWESYAVTVAPDWSNLAIPLKGSGIVGAAPSPGGSTNIPISIDGSLFDNLFNNIASSYNSAYDPWIALSLSAAGRTSSIDREKLTADSYTAFSNPDTTNLQRYSIALSAAGVDARAVPTTQGTINLIDRLAKSSASYSTLYGKLFSLLAYACGSYPVPQDALFSIDDLISDVLANQNIDGSFSLGGGMTDSDTTAMAIAALAPYDQNRADVNYALSKALAALHSFQKTDGSFASATWVSSGDATSNPNSTAMVVIALCAMGLDPASTWATETGGTPLSALMSFSNTSQTGFLFYGFDNPLATEQGFRALVAYRGLVNASSAYNIYLQAGKGQKSPTLASADTSANNSSVQPPATLANTSDNGEAFLIATILLIICAGSGTALARRKYLNPQESFAR